MYYNELTDEYVNEFEQLAIRLTYGVYPVPVNEGRLVPVSVKGNDTVILNN